MGTFKLAATAAFVAAGLVLALGAPAHADAATGSSICAVTADSVLGTSETTIGIRVQSFDCAGEAVPFSGSVAVAPIDDVQASPWTYGEATASAAVESADGAPAVGLVDIGALKTGFGRVVYDLTAAGDPTPFVEPASDGNNSIVLSRDPMWASSAWTDLTHTGSPVPYVFMERERQLWGCDTVLNVDAACVLSSPTTSDQTWQKGYKLTLSWPDPGLDSSGRPYQRCRVRSGVWLSAEYPSPTGGSASTSFAVAIDVPASWTSYTLPLGNDIRFPSWVTPGASTLDISYWCYSNRGNGMDWTGLKTVDRVLVPDLPPTQPTSVDADGSDGDLVTSVGGSVALGTAPLQGYDVSVVDAGGTTVDTAAVPATSVTPMRVLRSAVARPAAPSHRFSHLAPGRYTVRVSAFNTVGSSDAVVSKVVTVAARTTPAVVSTTPPVVKPAPHPLTAPTAFKAKWSHSRISIVWKRPASVGSGIARYTVRVYRGAHVVQRATVSASHRAFVSQRLTRKGAYRVVLRVVAKDGRSRSVSKTIRR